MGDNGICCRRRHRRPHIIGVSHPFVHDTFDYIDGDDTFGESTWEKSESAMQKQALGLALNKGCPSPLCPQFCPR